MTMSVRTSIAVAATLAVMSVVAAGQAVPVPNSQPNPYAAGQSWGQLPSGRPYGNTSAVHVDARGVVWVADKCASTSCTGRTDDPILAFDSSGRFLRSFGRGLFVFPHGIHVDGDGN